MTVRDNVQHTRQQGLKATAATTRASSGGGVGLSIPPFSIPDIVNSGTTSGAWFPGQSVTVTQWHYSAIRAGDISGNTVFEVYVGDANHNLDGTTEHLVLTISEDVATLEDSGSTNFTIAADQYMLIFVSHSVDHENVVLEFFP